MTSAAFSTLFERLNAALPQTQCTRCGYPDCAAYAQAIASNEAPINQCPPGGAEGVARLAAITGQPALPLNPRNGLEAPRAVAVIDEAWCIGCTLCLPVCPTDAIFGSNKVMHSVIEPHCTGCALCLPVCPVDCISLQNVTEERSGWAAWSDEQAERAHQRYALHLDRQAKDGVGRLEKPGQRLAAEATAAPRRVSTAAAAQPGDSTHEESAVRVDANAEAAARKRAVIDAVLARARALRKN